MKQLENLSRLSSRLFAPHGSRFPLAWVLALLLPIPASAAAAGADRPTITVTAPNTVLTQSCRVVIPKGLIIRDVGDQGVIIVGAPNIEIDFAKGSVLRGSPTDGRPDEYKGYGIRLNGQAGVTIRGARISGFWCALWATNANGLMLDDIDASDNRRAYLRSTPVAEDGGDWLFGHNNDVHEWLKTYAAAVYIEESASVTVRNSRVWHGQNALCLDRVTDSKIYDNDFSFNSGWGIALWRCERNVISRNAVDFCVRGYSHGVYNRGQDSAGIFVFEQNNKNVFAENSVTHGGDGFFGFAGREAIGEIGEHPVEWYKRRGNTDNLLIGNDFSYAPAHGIENTFSFGNKYLKNRIVGNGICGIWAGYSRESLIAGNDFENNGEMGYGLERGGVNIDHGGDNFILQNSFLTNKCGVHLWGGPNPDFDKRNWGKANGYASTGSVIAGNTFDGDSVAFHFRGPGDVVLGPNKLVGVGKEIMAEAAYQVKRDDQRRVEPLRVPEHEVFGTKHPVGARPELRGRQNIIMTEWGPWDHVAPLVRMVKSAGGNALFEVLKVPSADVRIETVGDHVRGVLAAVPGKADESQITISATEPGVRPYVLKVRAAGKPLAEMKGTLLAAQWQATFFKWPTNSDPRTNLTSYRKLAEGPGAVSAQLDELSLRYGMRGPSELGISEKVTAAKLGRDHFGMIARTRLPLTKGNWELSTLSDDGVRVSVDGKPVIENWAWHGPTRDAGTLELAADKTIDIEVEHFQIDGYAVLEFSLSRQPDPAPKLPGVSEAMQKAVENGAISGAVTLVVTKDKILHCDATGLADIAQKEPMTPDSLFWIASMTKPVTATAVLMLQDEGKLNVTDPVAKYIPEFAELKTPSGQPANLTIAQMLTHTSGLGEAPREAAAKARTLADLIPLFLAAPMQYEPGAKWSYTQSGINVASRIVEVVSGLAFDVFVQQRILDPLGMTNTTFYPAQKSAAHQVVAYKKNKTTAALEAAPPLSGFGTDGHPPLGNGGLFSTGPDYARFCQMLLAGGSLDGKRYLSPEAMKLLMTVQTGDLPTGFFQSAEFGNRGTNYGWGIGTCILRVPHSGVPSMLSPGTFGHGGAWGTQAWIDPARGVAFILMVQRTDFPNSDASEVRQAFQQTAADALGK